MRWCCRTWNFAVILARCVNWPTAVSIMQQTLITESKNLMETFIKAQQCFKVLNYFKTNAKYNEILCTQIVILTLQMDLDFVKCLKLLSTLELLIAQNLCLFKIFSIAFITFLSIFVFGIFKIWTTLKTLGWAFSLCLNLTLFICRQYNILAYRWCCYLCHQMMMMMIMILTSVGVISGVTVTYGRCYANNGVLGRCWTSLPHYPVLFSRGHCRPRDLSFLLILRQSWIVVLIFLYWWNETDLRQSLFVLLFYVGNQRNFTLYLVLNLIDILPGFSFSPKILQNIEILTLELKLNRFICLYSMQSFLSAV